MNLKIDLWKPFYVADIFDIFNGSGITKEEIEDNPGDFTAVQSGEENNGCIGKIDRDYCIAMNYTYSNEQCLTVARTGSAGFVAFQPFGCVVGDSAKILILKNPKAKNIYTYLFLRTILMANKYKYTYGRKVTESKYMSETIMLPVTNEGLPDYEFMEQYIKSLRYKPLCTNNKAPETSTIDIKSWKEYYLRDLFKEIYKAEAHVKNDLITYSVNKPGLISFISRTEENNGCDCYIDRQNETGIEQGNAIIIGDTTSTCFYQEKEFVTGDHIVVCRADWMNKYTALFVTTILQSERYRYNYGRAFKMKLIKETIIKLPSIDGKPDWIFIENFIKSLPYGDRI